MASAEQVDHRLPSTLLTCNNLSNLKSNQENLKQCRFIFKSRWKHREPIVVLPLFFLCRHGLWPS